MVSPAEEAFERWLIQEDVLLKGCSLGPNPAAVRGVIADWSHPAGQTIVSVPDELVLMPHTSSITDELEHTGLCNASGNAKQETLGLIIAVMVEKCLGKDSSWAAYLDALPETIPGMPMFWTEEERRALKGTSLQDKSMGLWQLPGFHVEPPVQVEQQFQQVVQPFIKKHKALKWPAGVQQQYALYTWATAVVSAYSFTLGEDKFQAMVPVWDMLNHITGHCNVRLHHNSRKGALQMITTQPVAKGGELVNNYGPLSDSELLRRFGFIEPQANPHNGCKLPLAVVMQACYSATSESAATVADKMRFLRQHDLVPSDGWFTTDPHGQPQPHLIEAIRILLLPSAEYVTFKKQVDRWRCPLNRPLTQLQTVSSDITCVVHECATKRLEGLAVVHVGENDLAQSFPARAAQHVLRMECQALCGLQAWAKLQDGGSLVLLCRQVWQHVRTAT